MAIIEKRTVDGKDYWIDTDTVNVYKLNKSTVVDINTDKTYIVDYELSHTVIQDVDYMVIKARTILNDEETVQGKGVKIEASDFMDQLVYSYTKERTFSRLPVVSAWLEQAESLLAEELFKYDIFIDDLWLKGYGRVYYGEDVVGTFTRMGIMLVDDPASNNIMLRIEDMYTRIQFDHSMNPIIEFVAKDKTLLIEHPVPIEDLDDGLNYTAFELTNTCVIGKTLRDTSYLPVMHPEEFETEEAYHEHRHSLLSDDKIEFDDMSFFDDIF